MNTTPTIDDLSKTINIAGRQRMLCQRIGFLTLVIQNEILPISVLDDLKKAADVFRLSHRAIIEGDPAQSLPGLFSERLQTVYLSQQCSVVTIVEAFLDLTDQLIDSFEHRGTASPQRIKDLTQKIKDDLLPALNQGVEAFQFESRLLSKQIEEERRLEKRRLRNLLDEVKVVSQRIELIGLNAQIAAARAGGTGEEFGIVAEEFMAMAQRVSQLVVLELRKSAQTSGDFS